MVKKFEDNQPVDINAGKLSDVIPAYLRYTWQTQMVECPVMMG